MPYVRKIGIFVEGDDDKRFFKKAIFPYLSDKWPDYTFQIIRHREKNNEEVIKYIKSFKDQECLCFFFRDFDKGPCYSAILEKTTDSFHLLDFREIFIVRKSIESWYLSVASKKFLAKHQIDIDSINTEDISKNKFKGLFHSENDSLIKIKILMNINIEVAKERNQSFKRFIQKMEDLILP
jgi:hypothetical protein